MSWHDRAFDDTATKVMGIAFDAVCEKMDGLAYPDVVKEIIAKRIIEVASRTRAADPECLVDEVVLRAVSSPGGLIGQVRSLQKLLEGNRAAKSFSPKTLNDRTWHQ